MEILRLCSLINTDVKIITSWEYKWTNQPVKILSFYLTINITNLHDLNITPQLTKIDNVISIWKLWEMIPYGHITIVKTLLISQLIYKLTLLPTVKVIT